MAEKEMPIGIKVLSILYFIGAGLMALIGLLMIVGGGFMGPIIAQYVPQSGPLGMIIGVGIIVMGVILIGAGVLDIFIGRGLWNGKNWARILAAIFAVLGVLSNFVSLISGKFFSLVFLAINAAIAYYLLMNEDVKAAFA